MTEDEFQRVRPAFVDPFEFRGVPGDQDKPYFWGRSASTLLRLLHPMSFARLLILRGRIQDARVWGGLYEDDLHAEGG